MAKRRSKSSASNKRSSAKASGRPRSGQAAATAAGESPPPGRGLRGRVSAESRLARGIVAHRGIIILTAIGAAVRLDGLGRRGLWVDEALTWNYATRGYYSLTEGHGVYFSLVSLALKWLGTDEAALRMASALLGIASIPMIYLATAKLWSRREGLIAAAILTGYSWLIIFSQEARFYTGIFFFASLMLYALAGLWRTGRFRYLVLTIVAAPLLRGMHPTAVVLCGTALAWAALWLLGWPKGRSALAGWITWNTGEWNRRAKITAAAAAIGLLGTVAGAWWLARPYLYILGTLSFANETENVEFTRAFFAEHYRVFGLSMPGWRVWAPVLALIHVAATALGWWRSLRSNLVFALFTASSILVACLLLFSYETFQPYQLKYSMYLYPPVLALLSAGAVGLIDLAARPLGAARRDLASRWSLTALAGALVLGGLLNHWPQRAGEFAGFKSAVKAIEKRFKTGDRVLSHDFGRAAVQYHVLQSKIPLGAYTMLEDDLGGGQVESARILAMAATNHDVWLIGSFDWRIREELRRFCEQHFDVVERFPSVWGPGFEVQLMKWSWAGRTVDGVGRQSIRFDPPLEVASDRPTTASLFVHRAGSYRFAMPEGIHIEGAVAAADGEALLVELELGPVELILLSAEGGARELTELTLEPEPGTPIRIEAERASRFASIGRFEIRRIEQRSVIAFPVNCGARYEVEFPESGEIAIDVAAWHSPPNPSVYELTIDGRPQALLAYTRRDGTFGALRTILRAAPGRHLVGLAFIDDMPSGAGPDKDLTGMVDWIEITPLAAGESALIPDQRFDVTDFLCVAGEGLALNPAQGWKMPKTMVVEVVVPDFAPESAAIRMHVPPQGGAAYGLERFPVEAGKWVYYDIEIATEGMINHTANALIYYFDESDLLMNVNDNYISLAGLVDTRHWQEGFNHEYQRRFERFAAFQQVPPGAVNASLSLACYDNSRRPLAKEGSVWYRNMHVYGPAAVMPGLPTQ